MVKNKFMEPELQIIYKNGNKKLIRIEELTISIINKRIQYFKFYEIIKNKK